MLTQKNSHVKESILEIVYANQASPDQDATNVKRDTIIFRIANLVLALLLEL